MPASLLADDRKGMRDMVEKLYNIGLDSSKVELPMIAVMGDTSAGKSSLLTQLSTIEFPTDSNICTRAPTRLCMSNADTFSARVSVEWEGDEPTASAAAGDVVEKMFDQASADWVETPSAVTPLIREAQAYLLERRGKGQSGVVRDVVRVDVRGPDFDELTVVDLPGLVHAVGDGESKSLIDDIKELLWTYLQNKRCVVACVIPATNDAHNQKVLEMCKEVDPEQKRTVPVVTKPDRVGEGDEKALEGLLRGDYRKFHHGFFMVKCRSTKDHEDKLSVAQAVDAEEEFFRTTEPWAHIAADRNDELYGRFGTRHVRKYLADVQSELLRTELPKLLEEFREKLAKCKQELEDCGTQPPHDDRARTREFNDHAKDIENAMRRLLDGIVQASPSSGTRQTWPALLKSEFDGLCRALFSVRPLHEIRTAKEKALVFDGDELLVFPYCRSHSVSFRSNFKVRKKNDTTGAPYQVADLGTLVDLWLESDPKTQRRGRVLYETDDPGAPRFRCVVLPDDGVTFGDHTTHEKLEIHTVPGDVEHMMPVDAPNELRERMQAVRTMDLDVFLSPEVFKAIFNDFIEDNVRPLVMQSVKAVCNDLLPQLIDTAIAGQKQIVARKRNLRGFKRLMDGLRSDLLASISKQVIADVCGDLERETVHHTQNDYFIQTIQRRRFDPLRTEIQTRINATHQMDSKVFMAIVDSVIEQQITQSPDDLHVNEMHSILQSYWRVVAKGLIDIVPKTVYRTVRNAPDLFVNLAREVATDTIVDAFDESNDMARRRDQKQAEVDKNKKAIETLEALERS